MPFRWGAPGLTGLNLIENFIRYSCTFIAKNSAPLSVWIRWIRKGLSSFSLSINLMVFAAERRLYKPKTLYRVQSSTAVFWYKPGAILQVSSCARSPGIGLSYRLYYCLRRFRFKSLILCLIRIL